MKLDFIPLDRLYVDKANMRHGRKAPDVADILPSIRKRGVIQSLVVRPGEGDCFGILAGSRRFHAGGIVAAERAANDAESEPFQFPCAILEDGDDAAAIEASLIENMARLDPDEVTRWESFVRLVREGRSPEDIADTFALPLLAVKRTLALGNLLPRIRNLYRRDEIDAATVRHLAMASKAQQGAWLALLDDPEARAPTGHQLRAWLFGGSAIAAGHALFEVEASGLAVVADLFGGERYFADSQAFWTAQDAAIEARRSAYMEAGWSDVVIVPATTHFQSWEYEKMPKRKGGRVYIDVRASGEVVFHEGWLSRKEARKAERASQPETAKPARPEMTATLRTCVDLHRHAAVRAVLADHPQVALRLMVAHAVIGSHLFRVSPETQGTRDEAVRASVLNGPAERRFDAKRRAILGLLGLDADRSNICSGTGNGTKLALLFQRLLDLPDAVILEIVAIVMGEALASGSAAVEAVGLHLNVAMADWWHADPEFLDLIRDREVLAAMVAEVAGKLVASANAKEPGKVLRRIIADHLAGTGGRDRVERWVPRWMAFPPSAYTARGGVGTVTAAKGIVVARANDDEPDPAAPAPAIQPEDAAKRAA